MSGGSQMVGPVLEGSPAGNALARAILKENAGAVIEDHGSYLRVRQALRCEVTRAAIEREIAAPFRLPADLERLMPSFEGFLSVDTEHAAWSATRR